MANLSDLLADGGAPAVPGWVAMLSTGSGFQERGWSSTAAVPESPEQDDPAAARAAELSEAYDRGLADGLAVAAQQQSEDDTARDALTLAFTQLDAAARSALTERLVQAVSHLCEQMIEPALIDRAVLAQRCARLADTMGAVAEDCTLHIHPADLPMLPADIANAWSIQPDPALTRGSLLLEHAGGAVADGPDEWRRLIASALGA